MREIDAMPAHELFEWMVYEGIEPFADRRADIHAAQICSMLANVNRTKQSDKLYSPTDFMLKWETPPPPKAQTVEEQFEMMKMIQGLQAARGNPTVKPN